MMRHKTSTARRRPLCILLALAILLTAFTALPLTAQAAGTPTSLGLAEHGVMAYNDGWEYVSGGKGGDSNGNGVRESDCAGLIYSYFSDLGAAGGVYGGASSQVRYNCAFSGDIEELQGIPRIHGLVLTVPNFGEPEYPYSHIGIYIGNNTAVDNSDSVNDMRWGPVVGSYRGWTAWHVFDAGTQYPSNGWYEFNGALYHYTNCQYDVDQVMDGFTIGSDGVALGSDGQPLSPDSPEAPALSTEYVSASTVAGVLRSLGYSGKDSTEEIVSGGDDVPAEDDLNGRVTGNGVNLRQAASTSSAIVATLSLNDRVQITGTVTGQAITVGGQTTDQWYQILTAEGRSGYVCSLYVERESPLAAPTFSLEDGYLIITAAEGTDIRYTSDGTHPTAESTPYTGPIAVSGTYRAIAVQEQDGQDAWTSPMATVTFAGGSLFSDFTDEAWYFSHVDQAVSAGLFGGSDGVFRPTDAITRAEFASAMAKLAGVDVAAYTGASIFSDVSSSAWYSGAVNWISSQKVMNGFEDNTFRPSDPITREQICVALANYANLSSSGKTQAFSDDNTIASWAKDAVYACRDLGLISGMGNNLFDPKGQATRAQACAIILNAYNQNL